MIRVGRADCAERSMPQPGQKRLPSGASCAQSPGPITSRRWHTARGNGNTTVDPSCSETIKEAGIESVDVAGYERILAALGKRGGAFIQEWTTKAAD